MLVLLPLFMFIERPACSKALTHILGSQKTHQEVTDDREMQS